MRTALRYVLICLVILSSPHRSYPEIWKDFISFEDLDLKGLDRIEATRLNHLLKGVVPGSCDLSFSAGLFSSFAPYRLARVKNPGNPSRYVLVEGQPLIIIPGESRARIHIFDTKGRHLYSSAFPTGWRIDLVGARVLEDGVSGPPVVEISTHAAIGGRDVSRQFYSLIGDKVALVRLEDSKGRILREDPYHQIGP